MTATLPSTEYLTHYWVIVHSGLPGWLCRRCRFAHVVLFDSPSGAEGLTLADMHESAAEHEHKKHLDPPAAARVLEAGTAAAGVERLPVRTRPADGASPGVSAAPAPTPTDQIAAGVGVTPEEAS